jgi:hypothetical protein
LYPNPSNGLFLRKGGQVGGSLTIYDALENTLEEKVCQNELTEINLFDQPNGIYFIIVNFDSKVNIKKVIKE